ncbi:phage tail-collar fiber domain-containing protein [Enterobacter ludwigii]
MAEKYYSILTNRGKELEAQSSATGKPVIIKDFVVGDGNGQAVKPDPVQTKLVREVYRNAISALQVSPDQENQFIAQLVLPVDVGGFVVREVGLLTDAGELYSVANCAAIEKPENGVSVSLQYRLAVSEKANIELKVATGDGLFLRIDKNLAEIAAKGEVAQKSSREAIGVLDATTVRKGLVQLSSASDSSSEALAATPKAVKAAYDLAKGKYTAQDATTAQKGIVQLSSATDSTSEALAATPKAVKAANDNANGRVPSGRKVNGRGLSTDINITAQDIFNGQAVGIGNAEDLNAYTTPGLYYQPANAQAQTGRNYPEANAGSLEVYKHAGITQIYRVYNSSRSYIRTLYSGTWSGWVKQYDAANKPSPADIGAVNKSSDTMTGRLIMNVDGEAIRLQPKTAGYASYIICYDSSNTNHWYVGAGSTTNANVTLLNYKGANNSITLNSDGTVNLNPTQGKSAIVNGPLQVGAVGSAALNIGDNDSGLRSSKDGQVDLWANSKVMGYWNTTTFSFTGQIIPTNYSNFDARFIIADSASYAGFASNDAARPYMRHKASNAVVELARKGDAYTKAESDGRFQPKGNYTPAGQAYTKAESDARYGVVNGIRRGGQQLRNPTDAWFGNWESPAGCVVTGITMENRSDGRKLGVYFRQMQYLNKQTNAWVNIGD